MGTNSGDIGPMISTTARHRRKVVVPTPPLTAESAPYTPSPEFAAAYAMPHNEVGPIASRWDERGYAVWLLPVHTITQAPRRAYTPRITPNF
jgi:hypothetical protein